MSEAANPAIENDESNAEFTFRDPQFRALIAPSIIIYGYFIAVTLLFSLGSWLIGEQLSATFFIVAGVLFALRDCVFSSLQIADYADQQLEGNNDEISVTSRNFLNRDRKIISKQAPIDLLATSGYIIVAAACVDIIEGKIYQSAVFIIYLSILYAVGRILPKIGIKLDGYPYAFFALALLPMLVNFPISGEFSSQYLAGTSFRMIAISVMCVAVIAVVFILSEFLSEFAAKFLFQIAPARRKLSNMNNTIKNVISFFEFLHIRQMRSIGFSCVAIGAVMYYLYGLSESRWVFLIFNLIYGIPIAYPFLRSCRSFDIDIFRVTRRIAIQYSLICLAVINVLAACGYLIGFVFKEFYEAIFGVIGKYPLPEQLLRFREQSPFDLPLVAQIEAYIIVAVIVLALTWLILVVQKKRWGELLWVSAVIAVVAAAPLYEQQVKRIFLDYFPLLSEVPSFLIAVVIPAIKGLFTSDLEDYMKGDVGLRNIHSKT